MEERIDESPANQEFLCPCPSKYSTRQSLMKLKEMRNLICSSSSKASETRFKCNICMKYYASRQSLWNHVAKMHVKEYALKKASAACGPKVECTECHSEFSTKKSLLKHNKKVHSAEPKRMVKCDYCNVQCSTLQNLVRHWQKDHDKNINILQQDFLSFDDFIHWKKKQECISTAWFVKRCGTTHRKDRSFYNYYCNRAGTYQSTGKGKRRLKSQGSCKAGSHCSAFISASLCKTSGKVKATYCFDHCGHDAKVAHMRMSDDVRLKILSQLTSGVKIDCILKNIRDDISEISRDSLVTRRDIHNIKNQFNISTAKGYSEDSEPASKNEGQNIALVEEILKKVSKSESIGPTKTMFMTLVKQVIDLVESTTSLDVVKTVMEHMFQALTVQQTAYKASYEAPSSEDKTSVLDNLQIEAAELCTVCWNEDPPNCDMENVMWIQCSKCNTVVHEQCTENADSNFKFRCKCK